MKKTLIAAAVMAASGVAFAASNVTLYGVIDTGLLVSKVKHKDTLVQMSTGFDSGSRWGIKGVEDLGNGYAVGFQLEQGFDSDTGADNATSSAGKSFGRESRLYVTGAFGELGFGRFGSLASGAGSYNILTGWVFGTSYDVSGSWTSFGRANSRVNNAIAYVSPSFAGFNLYAMYSNGTSDDANKWAKNDHYYGLGLKYANGPAKASLIFEAADNKSNYDIAATAEPWDVGSKLVEKFTKQKRPTLSQLAVHTTLVLLKHRASISMHGSLISTNSTLSVWALRPLLRVVPSVLVQECYWANSMEQLRPSFAKKTQINTAHGTLVLTTSIRSANVQQSMVTLVTLTAPSG